MGIEFKFLKPGIPGGFFNNYIGEGGKFGDGKIWGEEFATLKASHDEWKKHAKGCFEKWAPDKDNADGGGI